MQRAMPHTHGEETFIAAWRVSDPPPSGPDGKGTVWKSPKDLVGFVATVKVDGKTFTGRVYHVRENGWVNVETPDGHIASGPLAQTL